MAEVSLTSSSVGTMACGAYASAGIRPSTRRCCVSSRPLRQRRPRPSALLLRRFRSLAEYPRGG